MTEYAPTLVLIAIVLAVGIALSRWQKSHEHFDLSDLLTGDNGKVSLSKCGQAAALAVSTWGFVVLVQTGKLTESYFIGYMTIWSGTRIMQTFAEKKATE